MTTQVLRSGAMFDHDYSVRGPVRRGFDWRLYLSRREYQA